MSKKKKVKSEKIGFNQHEYDRLTEIELQLFENLQELQNIVRTCLGTEHKIYDLEYFLKSPLEYLISEFWKINKHLFPQTIKPEDAFANTSGYAISYIKNKKEVFWNNYKKLGKHTPKITDKGVVSTINKEDFNIYLDEDKKEHYNALKQFIEAFKELGKHEKQKDIYLSNISQYIVYNREGLGIRTHKFSQK